VILVKSFARIHETNLKKQGMLGLTFANKEDYNKIQEDDTIDFTDLTSFRPEVPLTLVVNHKDGTKDTIRANHTYNANQILWFKAGSALNLMAEKFRSEANSNGPAKPAKPAAKNKAKPKAKAKTKSKAKAKPARKAARKPVAKKAAKKKTAKAKPKAKKKKK
jgi:aconitate hydratase